MLSPLSFQKNGFYFLPFTAVRDNYKVPRTLNVLPTAGPKLRGSKGTSQVPFTLQGVGTRLLAKRTHAALPQIHRVWDNALLGWGRAGEGLAGPLPALLSGRPAVGRGQWRPHFTGEETEAPSG